MGPIERPSSDLLLLSACAVATFDRAALPGVRRLAAAITDWDALVRLADRQQVSAHVHSALRAAEVTLPADADEALNRRAGHLRRRALKVIGEGALAIAALRSAGIDAIALKGPFLAKLAFDDPTIRRATDLDLLVDPAAMHAARGVLVERGYEQTNPIAPDLSDPALLERYLNYRKDISLQRPGGVRLELHCRLTNNPHLFDMTQVAANPCNVEVAPNLRLPTFTGDALIRYLCVHGGLTLWDSIKWLADVAALLHRRDDAGRSAFLNSARESGLERPVGQALLMLDWLEMLSLDAALRQRLLRDGPTRWLFALARGTITTSKNSEANALRYALPLSTTLMWRMGWRSRGAEIWRLLVDADRVLARGRSPWAAPLALARLAPGWSKRLLGQGRRAE